MIDIIKKRLLNAPDKEIRDFTKKEQLANLFKAMGSMQARYME